jgi:hypothetical protein
MICAAATDGSETCGAHPRLLLAALWGQSGGARRERLQAAYLAAHVHASVSGAWRAERFKLNAVRQLLPWREEERGELAEVMRGELREGHCLAEAEIAAMLGLDELRGLMDGFEQGTGLKLTAARRDLEIKAAGGKEPSDVRFLEAHEEFEQGLQAHLDAAALGERLKTHMAHSRAGVALMLHCEIIDNTGEMFVGSKAVRACEVAAVLGLGELDEVVYMFADQYSEQAGVALVAAGVLARVAGGRVRSHLDGEEA